MSKKDSDERDPLFNDKPDKMRSAKYSIDIEKPKITPKMKSKTKRNKNSSTNNNQLTISVRRIYLDEKEYGISGKGYYKQKNKSISDLNKIFIREIRKYSKNIPCPECGSKKHRYHIYGIDFEKQFLQKRSTKCVLIIFKFDVKLTCIKCEKEKLFKKILKEIYWVIKFSASR